MVWKSTACCARRRRISTEKETVHRFHHTQTPCGLWREATRKLLVRSVGIALALVHRIQLPAPIAVRCGRSGVRFLDKVLNFSLCIPSMVIHLVYEVHLETASKNQQAC